MTLGEEAKSKGFLTIDVGSVSMQGEFVIGEAGSGTALSQSGATLDGAGSKAPDIVLAEKVGATGSLTVNGDGNSVSAGSLEVGALGKATIAIIFDGKSRILDNRELR